MGSSWVLLLQLRKLHLYVELILPGFVDDIPIQDQLVNFVRFFISIILLEHHFCCNRTCYVLSSQFPARRAESKVSSKADTVLVSVATPFASS